MLIEECSLFYLIRKKKLPDAFSRHGAVLRHMLLKGISAQIVSAAVSHNSAWVYNM